MRWKHVLLSVGGLGVVALLALPHLAPSYLVALVLLTFAYIALASSWNLISGYTGYVSFGHVAFFGTGAYTAAILITKYGVPWLLASLAGGVVAVGIAAPIGFITLRLKGPYFAIAMLGLAEVFRIVAAAWEPLTRGGKGIHLPPILDLTAVYYAMGGCALAAVLLTYRIANSRFGLRLLSIREDEIAAEVMGINTTRHKLAAFVLSTFFPGVVGGVHAFYVSYIDPHSVFSVTTTIRMIIMTMFGGAGTVFGPVIGAASLTLLAEYFWAQFPFLHQALFGALIVAVVIFTPGGILALLRERGLLPRTRGY